VNNKNLIFSVWSCDDASWISVQKQYDSCVEEKSQELKQISDEQGDPISLESCRQALVF